MIGVINLFEVVVMKRKKFIIAGIIIFVLVIVLIMLSVSVSPFFSKKYEDSVIASLPEYEKSDCYYSKGFQDYTDYCKYYYEKQDNIIDALKENEYFKSVTENDIEEIKSYFENFNCWVKYENYKDEYDFQDNSIDITDYFYIENNDNCEKYAHHSNKYDAYNVYFFDVQSKILFYIHSNI